MDGKTVIVTGANSGLGFQATRVLAAQGARVVMACRDPARGENARERLLAENPAAKLELSLVDVSRRASIDEFAARFAAQHDSLDVLINNAGIYTPRRALTEDGIERVFATNVLAYHVLIRSLAGRLERGADPRIINVASDFAGDLDLDDLQFERRRYDGRKAYRQSKACDRLLTWAWAERLQARGVSVNAMVPGMVMTGLYRDTGMVLHAFMRLLARAFGRSVEEGADTICWLASAPEVEAVTGKLFDQRRAKPCSFADPEAQARLFEVCESLTRG